MTQIAPGKWKKKKKQMASRNNDGEQKKKKKDNILNRETFVGDLAKTTKKDIHT